MRWSPLGTWTAVGVEICHLCVPSFRDRQYGNRGSGDRDGADRVPHNSEPGQDPAAAQAAAIGRLGCNWRRVGEECASLYFVTCPYSFLAGLRVGRLIGVKWRAVVHDATAPLHGQPVPDEQADFVNCGSAWVSKP